MLFCITSYQTLIVLHSKCVCVFRLKVKKGLVSMVAQKTLTTDLWAVTLERSQGSKHDVVSILCRKHITHKHTHK